MYAVTYKFEDVEDTATMSDTEEIKAVFHAGIAMGLQYLEVTDAGGLLEMLMPGTFDKAFDEMKRLVDGAEISVKQV